MKIWRSTLVSMLAIVLIRQSSAQTAPASLNPTTTDVTNSAPSQPARVVRDPLTGRTFYQQWVTETVPATRWENKQVTTTTYETHWVNQIVPTTQTVYQPQTQTVPRAYWKGAWNPFRQPTLAYEYKTVVSWVPTATTVNQNVPRQTVVPKQVTISVPQLVTQTKTQQRLVQTEIPQPTANGSALPIQPQVVGYTAAQRPALLNIPLLARQTYLPTTASPVNYSSHPSADSSVANPAMGNWSARSSVANNSSNNQVAGQGWNNTTGGSWNGTNWNAPAQATFTASPATGLRPATRMLQNILPPTTYNAPMRTASGQGGSWSSLQTGMQPTVLR